MAAPKRIEVFRVKRRKNAKTPERKGGDWQFRAIASNGKNVAPHSESSHSKTWTKILAKREADKFTPPIPVEIV